MNKIKDFSTLTFDYNCDRPFQFISNKVKDIELKRKFKNKYFKQKTINELASHFEFLGYDLNKEYILSYANLKNVNSGNNLIRKKELKVFNWKTTTGGWYETSIWDYMLKISFRTRKYCNIKDHILSHVFPLETTSPRVKDTILNKNHIKRLKYASTAVGSTIKETSNMLIIDIDCHDRDRAKTEYQVSKLKTYLSTFNCTPVMEEISPEGGHHIYVRLDSEYTWNEKIAWLKNFNKENETSFELPQKMRFPHCYQYETITDDGEILNPFESIEYVKKNETYISIPKLQEVENNVIDIVPIINNIKNKKNVVSATYQRQSKNKKRITDFDQFLIDKTLHLKDEDIIIDITAGHRHYNMWKITKAGKFSGWSISQIITAIKACNNGSRDLAIWDEMTLYKVVEDMYNYSTIIQDGYSGEYKEIEFISNIHLIPENIKSTSVNNQVINTILSKSNQKISERNKKHTTIIFLEMLGSMYYNCINPKEVKPEQPTKYLKGMQYSITYAERLKAYYPELEGRNVFGIINSILKHSTLFKQFMFCERGWKHSIIHPELNICRLFNLSNNITNSIITFKNTLSYYILNSLLNLIKDKKTNNILLYPIFFNKVKSIIGTLEIETEYLTDVG
jgi:hypothetical protein